MSETGSVGDLRPSRDWRALTRPRAGLLAALVLGATIVGRAGSWWWGFDLVSHFAPQLALAGALACTLSLWARGIRWASVAGVSVVVNGLVVAPVYVAGSTPCPIGSEVRLITYNLNAANLNTAEVIEYLSGNRCDLLLALEVTPTWLQALRRLEPEYRIELAEPRTDNFGIALLSRGYAVTAQMVRAPESNIGFVEAQLTVDGKDWRVLGVHSVPPVGAAMTAERNSALEFVAAWATRQHGPSVVLGDLNTTPFSPTFRRLLADANLVNTQQGHGIQPTWPQSPWFMLPARIPIDHALHSPDLVTTARWLGPSMGSDHRPLGVTLALAGH